MSKILAANYLNYFSDYYFFFILLQTRDYFHICRQGKIFSSPCKKRETYSEFSSSCFRIFFPFLLFLEESNLITMEVWFTLFLLKGIFLTNFSSFSTKWNNQLGFSVKGLAKLFYTSVKLSLSQFMSNRYPSGRIKLYLKLKDLKWVLMIVTVKTRKREKNIIKSAALGWLGCGLRLSLREFNYMKRE